MLWDNLNRKTNVWWCFVYLYKSSWHCAQYMTHGAYSILYPPNGVYSECNTLYHLNMVHIKHRWFKRNFTCKAWIPSNNGPLALFNNTKDWPRTAWCQSNVGVLCVLMEDASLSKTTPLPVHKSSTFEKANPIQPLCHGLKKLSQNQKLHYWDLIGVE